jgi:hypothetical protein
MGFGYSHSDSSPDTAGDSRADEDRLYVTAPTEASESSISSWLRKAGFVDLARVTCQLGFWLGCPGTESLLRGPVQGHRPEIATMNDKPIAAGVKIMELREDYQKLMQKQLNEWKAQTERFKADAEKIEAQNKAQYEKNLETLRAMQTVALENFNKLKSANESTWSELKAHMDKAGGEVKGALASMTRNFKH